MSVFSAYLNSSSASSKVVVVGALRSLPRAPDARTIMFSSREIMLRSETSWRKWTAIVFKLLSLATPARLIRVERPATLSVESLELINFLRLWISSCETS